jgi:hypothetical protein
MHLEGAIPKPSQLPVAAHRQGHSGTDLRISMLLILLLRTPEPIHEGDFTCQIHELRRRPFGRLLKR